ncbi:MAG: hypothetical protein E7612_06985 [Ruminococcaceae bacterium]|nr:hypothetical protein [Oscillospiraceae bacterium]
MGFGTLFFGYFLLLNITYYSFTDLIAALIAAMGLYKLSSVNRSFRNGFYASVIFGFIGLTELIAGVITMFIPSSEIMDLFSYIAAPRYFAIAILTLFIFKGIEEVSIEVGLDALAKKARISMPVTLFVYAASAILEVPIFESAIKVEFFAIASAVVLLLTLIIVGVNLSTIYKAYMKICMPEDIDNDYEETPSRFAFVNRHREHTMQKQREYAEYKLEKMKNRASKKKKKK